MKLNRRQRMIWKEIKFFGGPIFANDGTPYAPTKAAVVRIDARERNAKRACKKLGHIPRWHEEGDAESGPTGLECVCDRCGEALDPRGDFTLQVGVKLRPRREDAERCDECGQRYSEDGYCKCDHEVTS